MRKLLGSCCHWMCWKLCSNQHWFTQSFIIIINHFMYLKSQLMWRYWWMQWCYLLISLWLRCLKWFDHWMESSILIIFWCYSIMQWCFINWKQQQRLCLKKWCLCYRLLKYCFKQLWRFNVSHCLCWTSSYLSWSWCLVRLWRRCLQWMF